MSNRRESSSATQKITKIDFLIFFFAFCFMIYFFVCAKSADPVSSCLGRLNTHTHAPLQITPFTHTHTHTHTRTRAHEPKTFPRKPPKKRFREGQRNHFRDGQRKVTQNFHKSFQMQKITENFCERFCITFRWPSRKWFRWSSRDKFCVRFLWEASAGRFPPFSFSSSFPILLSPLLFYLVHFRGRAPTPSGKVG